MPATPTRGQRTREALLAAAVTRFAQHGSKAATVSEIARDVGITPGSVYAHFPGKEDLFIAALDADAEQLMTHAIHAIGDDFRGDWQHLLAVLLSSLDDHPLAKRVLAGGEGTSADRLLVIPAEARLRQQLADNLRRGQANGNIRTDINPELTANGLITIVMAILIAALQTGGDTATDTDRTAGILAVLDSAIHAPTTHNPHPG